MASHCLHWLPFTNIRRGPLYVYVPRWVSDSMILGRGLELFVGDVEQAWPLDQLRAATHDVSGRYSGCPNGSSVSSQEYDGSRTFWTFLRRCKLKTQLESMHICNVYLSQEHVFVWCMLATSRACSRNEFNKWLCPANLVSSLMFFVRFNIHRLNFYLCLASVWSKVSSKCFFRQGCCRPAGFSAP